jgi:uncharacterized protein (DUF2141 family)
MYFKSKLSYLYWGCFIVLLHSCAQVVSPGGGPKDIAPPRALKYMPDSASTNFKSKSIIIAFDEYIQLRDLQTQLIISPPLNKTPEVKVKEKNVIVTIAQEDTLKANTTYVFSFGNSIVDNNEGNAKENFKYVFSTGEYIDSLSLTGKVQTAFNHKTEKNILVMLYKNYTDSSIYKSKPDYFAKTKEDGTFILTNLSAGDYTILALKDVNSNYIFDDEQESIAFMDSLVNPLSNKKISLELFNEPPKKQFLKKYIYNSFGKITFYFNKKADSIRIEPLNYSLKSEDAILDYSTSKDTLTYWFRNIEKDSLILQITNGYKVLDTIALKLIPQEEEIKNKKKSLSLKVTDSPDKKQNYDLANNLPIRFNHLIDSVQMDETWTLRKDSLPENMILQLKNNINKNTLELKKDAPYWLRENAKYSLLIPPGKITDFFGLKNDSINIAFKTNEETFYGTLKLSISLPHLQHYIVQLLDEKENIIRENYIDKSTVIDYKYLSPKIYRLKIIDDVNSNKKWDSGNFSKKIQSEKVIYNAEPINVRSNWDLELTWNIK